MSISMYSASVPVFMRSLRSLSGILAKAEHYARERKIEQTVLLRDRLFPDMFDFTRQVQIATDFARGTAARLAGSEPPPMEDNEASLAELSARVQRSIEYLGTFTAAQIDGSEGREIMRAIRGEPHRFTGIDYLLTFALPNFFFHVTTAYAILRHNGVALGKADFIGSLD